MEKKFVANKALIINGEGKILLMRDAGIGDHAQVKGLWDVPGGRMEGNETPLDGLKREVLEECGIDISACDIRPVSVSGWGTPPPGENYPIVGIHYAVHVKDQQEARMSDEHDAVEWFAFTELPSGLHPALGQAMEAYRKIYG